MFGQTEELLKLLNHLMLISIKGSVGNITLTMKTVLSTIKYYIY